AQVTLQPRSPEGTIDMNVPVRLLLNKYNDLELHVTQNYTNDCSDPTAPELWTNVELNDSYIELDYALKPVPLRLSSVADMLFDPKMFGPNIVNVTMENRSPELMRIAAIAVSGVALRFEYRPVRFTVSGGLISGVDNIVIGHAKFLTDIMGDSRTTLPDAPLSVLHMPGDREHALIYIGGDSYEVILKNAKAFSSLSYPLPDSASVLVKEVTIPQISQYHGDNIVAENTSYTFKDLGIMTRTFHGIQPGSTALTFRLPADALVRENENTVLSLHLVYSAGIRSDSSLNMVLNGEFAGSVPLNDEKGSRYQGYTIQIPGSLLKAGYNTLTFNPVLAPLKSGECIYLQTDNLVITLYDDSELKIPPVQHWIEMPSLAAFITDGFPFTKWPDWRDTTILLADRAAETAASALNLTAMISQKRGVQPFEIDFSYDLQARDDNDLIVMGPLHVLPGEILQGSPLESNLMYPWAGRLENTGSNEATAKKVSTDRSIGVGTEVVIGEDKLLISEFESPFRAEKSVMLVTAKGPGSLLRGMFALWEPAVQSAFSHDLLLVDLGAADPRVFSQEAGEKYYLGSVRGVNKFNYFLHKYFRGSVAVLIVCIILLAWIVYALLRRHKQKRLSNE
ncbi:MAG: cellulose biosynthesis cyclic di-GMP-binding regulatory protein BcsB, partial [Nitrospirota bacterium]